MEGVVEGWHLLLLGFSGRLYWRGLNYLHWLHQTKLWGNLAVLRRKLLGCKMHLHRHTFQLQSLVACWMQWQEEQRHHERTRQQLQQQLNQLMEQQHGSADRSQQL